MRLIHFLVLIFIFSSLFYCLKSKFINSISACCHSCLQVNSSFFWCDYYLIIVMQNVKRMEVSVIHTLLFQPRRRTNKRAKSVAAQIEQTKEGCVDLSPNSILAKINLKVSLMRGRNRMRICCFFLIDSPINFIISVRQYCCRPFTHKA